MHPKMLKFANINLILAASFALLQVAGEWYLHDLEVLKNPSLHSALLITISGMLMNHMYGTKAVANDEIKS